MSEVDDSSDFPRDLQHVDATIAVLSDNHTVLCSVSTLRLRATLIQTFRQILVASENGSGSTSACRNPARTSTAIVM